LGGLQPLWGKEVTSFIKRIGTPKFWIERIAASRPKPGPLILISICLNPWSIAFRTARSVTVCEAKGVDLRDPLKPHVPDDDHEITFPWISVTDTIE
jgi:hypothetical protein